MARVLSRRESRLGGTGLEASALGRKIIDASRRLPGMDLFSQPQLARRPDADRHHVGRNSPRHRRAEIDGTDLAGDGFSGGSFRAQFPGDCFPPEAEPGLGLDHRTALPAGGLSFRSDHGVSLLPILTRMSPSNLSRSL